MATQSNTLVLQKKKLRDSKLTLPVSQMLITVTWLKSQSTVMAVSKMAPNNPHLLVSVPSCDPFLSMGWT